MKSARSSVFASTFTTALAALALLAACGSPAKKTSKPVPSATPTPTPTASADPAPSPDPTPTAPTPSVAPVPAVDADIASLGEAIADLPARAAFTGALMKRRADGPGKRSYTVTDTAELTNAYSITLDERVEDASAQSCQVGPLVVELAKQDPALPPVELRSIGTDCCPGTACPAPTAMGAMLRFNSALHAKDLEGFRALIHPKRGLKIEMSDDSGTEKQTVKRAKLDLGKLHITRFIWANYELSCAEFDAKNEASCTASAGGFQGSYGLLREGGNVFLLTIEDSSH